MFLPVAPSYRRVTGRGSRTYHINPALALPAEAGDNRYDTLGGSPMRLLVVAMLFTLPAGIVYAQTPPAKRTPEQEALFQLDKERLPLLKEANALAKAGKYKEAIVLYEKILKMERGILSETHNDILVQLDLLAVLYDTIQDFTPAKKTWAELVLLRTKALGKDHWKTVDARNAEVQSKMMEGLDAEKVAQLVLAKKLTSEVLTLLKLAKYPEALPPALKAFEIRKKLLGEKYSDYAHSLNNLGFAYFSLGSYAEAEPLYLEALRIRKDLLCQKHPDYATSLNNLAACYKTMAEYAKAESLYIEAMQIRKEILGEKHADYARTMNNLGMLYSTQGRYSKAEPYLLEATRIRKEILGEKHSEYADGLNNLATLYFSQGLYAKAEDFFIDTMRIYKESVGGTHPNYAISLHNMAVLYQQQALFAKAEPLHLEALKIRKTALGEKHPAYANCLNSLAIHYLSQGLNPKAEPALIDAIRIFKNSVGENHPDYAMSLNNLAALYDSQKEYDKAEPLFLDAVRIRKATLGEQHPKYATSLNNLASLYKSNNQIAKAESLYRDALRIRKATLGQKHLDYAASLNNLGDLYYSQRKFDAAESLFEEATRIHKEALGEKHPFFATSLNNLVYLYRAQGLSNKAEPLQRQVLRIIQDHLEESAVIQSESDQISNVAISRYYLDSYLDFREADAVELYGAVFRWHGAVTARQSFARLASIGSPAIQHSIQELGDIARHMNQFVQNPPNSMTKDEQTKAIKKFDDDREALEKKLASQSKDYAAYLAHLKLTPADLQKALPEGTALVDFLVHGDKISAFIITKTAIRRVVLTGGKELDEELDDKLGFLSDLSLGRTIPAPNNNHVSAKLRKRIWEPLEKHLKGLTRVLLCPDGPLCRLPFAALPGSDPKKYLLEELSIVIVPVPQLLPGLLAVESKNFTGAPSLLAVGDVDFNGDPATGQEKKPLPIALTRSGNGLDWSRLPNSKREVEVVETLFGKLPQATVKKLLGADATEASIERELGHHRFVHLATHGFFAPPKFIRQMQEGQTIGGDKILVPVLPPGLSSGFVCTGANKPTFQASGVITATQIAELDLSAVELVVLSACETGLGELSRSEGVLGLQRAFQIAGARSTITSLWAVPDQSTAELMKQMYSNRLEKGLASAEALREAQLWVLNNGEKVGAFDRKPTGSKRTPPKFWAAFTFAGDWR
jgi:CHAT domain-containing protein